MLKINFKPFPMLQTARLYLRNISPDDAPTFLKMRSDPKVMRYIPRPLINDIDGVLEHIKMISDKIDNNEAINWVIIEKCSGNTIGVIGHYRIRPEDYRAEIGYMFLPEYAGKGYATEALREVVRYGFDDMDLNSVEGIIDPGNTASERVLQKNGFVKEAHIQENVYFNGRFLDSVIYSLLKSNYMRRGGTAQKNQA
jgi:ribosomal-protein-alanine N-acetyltransferase